MLSSWKHEVGSDFLVENQLMSDCGVCHWIGDGDSGSSLAQFEKKSVLHVQYKIVGDRRNGAHSLSWNGSEAEDQKLLDFSTSFVLKMPVLEQLVSVGMLPVPSQPPRVGHQIVFRWRIERLKAGRALPVESKQVGSNSKNNSPSTDQVISHLEMVVINLLHIWELGNGKGAWVLTSCSKESPAIDGGMLSRQCGDGLGHALVQQATMIRMQTSMIYILELWNGEGAWLLTQSQF